MKKEVYYLRTAFPWTLTELEGYLKQKNLFDGYHYKYPFAQTKLFGYIRTKPMSWWQLNKLAFIFAFNKARTGLGSDVEIYKAVS